MMLPDKDELMERLKDERISKRLIRDIRYSPEATEYAGERDFLTVLTKSGNEGVLLYDEVIVTIQLTKRLPNKSGRIEAIICDICATWQRGTNSAVMTIKKSDRHTASHLVCADLNCSLHIRDLTEASRVSRTQLREHITIDERIERLNMRLKALLEG